MIEQYHYPHKKGSFVANGPSKDVHYVKKTLFHLFGFGSTFPGIISACKVHLTGPQALEYCWPPYAYSLHQESSHSPSRRLQHGQDLVG